MIRTFYFYSLTLMFMFFAVKGFANFNDIGSGTLLLDFDNSPKTRWVAPTLKTDVELDVTGPIVRATLTQTFSNPGTQWAQGTYVFPLPETAAVDQLLMKVGDRVIEGEIKEKDEARQIFDEASKSGKKASLVSQQRENLFVTRVANIPPGESISVTIEYQHPVDKRGDIYSLRFPMTITPRYTPATPVDTNSVSGFDDNSDASHSPQSSVNRMPLTDRSIGKPEDLSPPWGAQGSNKNPTSLTLTLRPGFELDTVRSLFHLTNETRIDDNVFQLTLAEDDHEANRDFIVQWSPRQLQRPQVELFSEPSANQNDSSPEGSEVEDYHLLMVTPPAAELVTAASRREVIFVLDTSGSMGGESIRQAKRAVSWSLDRLQAHDRFNIIEFNSGSWNLFGNAELATTRNLNRAKQFVNSLEARGGTEMKPALEAALCGFCSQQDSLRQVVFITDGAVGNEDELFKVIKGKLGNSRLFTVGIGSAPNTFFMTKAAQAGRGTYTYIGDISTAGEAMAALFLTMESPMLTDVRITGDASHPLSISPHPIPDVYADRSLVIFLKGPLPPTLRIEANAGDKKWSHTLPAAASAEGKGIKTLWGRNQIESLMDQYRFSRDQHSRDRIRSTVTDIALRHHLVSAFTSLVAVEKTASRPAEAQSREHTLANNSPHGTRFGLSATATSSELSLLAGLLLMLAALFLRFYINEPGGRLAREI